MEGQKHSLVLIRNWFETPGWSTSWIAAAKMAARISKSVKTAYKKGRKEYGKGELAKRNQTANLVITSELFNFSLFTFQWEKTCIGEPTPDKMQYIVLGLVLDFRGVFTNMPPQEDNFRAMMDHPLPPEPGWTGGCAWTAPRRRHAGCCGKPHPSGSGPPGSSCRSQRCPLGSWRFSLNLFPADDTTLFGLKRHMIYYEFIP